MNFLFLHCTYNFVSCIFTEFLFTQNSSFWPIKQDMETNAFPEKQKYKFGCLVILQSFVTWINIYRRISLLWRLDSDSKRASKNVDRNLKETSLRFFLPVKKEVLLFLSGNKRNNELTMICSCSLIS